MRANKTGLVSVIKAGVTSVVRHLPIAFLTVAAIALLDALMFRGIIASTGAANLNELMNLNPQDKQALLIKVILGYTGLGLIKAVVIGPLIAAIVVYLGRCTIQDKNSSIYGAINFALGRYRRLFVPYLIAQLTIQIGMIFVIPGVMFLMQYAFVDAVACLEDEKHVVTRSKRLTRGRRRSLFLLILPWALATQIIGLVALNMSESILGLMAVNMVLEGLYFLMYSCFFMLYDQRNQQIEERKAERAKQANEKQATEIESSEPISGSSK